MKNYITNVLTFLLQKIHLISINTEFYTFLSLDAFSRHESGDNRKKTGKVGPKVYLFVLEFYSPVNNEVMSSRSVNSGTVPGQADLLRR